MDIQVVSWQLDFNPTLSYLNWCDDFYSMYRRNIEPTYNLSWYQVILGGTYLLIAQKISKPVVLL